MIWLDATPDVLETRLRKRVDAMVARGLRKELTALFKLLGEQNIDASKGVAQAIGFKEFLPWLQEEKQTEASWAKCVEDLHRA